MYPKDFVVTINFSSLIALIYLPCVVEMQNKIANKNLEEKVEKIACIPLVEYRVLYFFLSFIELCILSKACKHFSYIYFLGGNATVVYFCQTRKNYSKCGKHMHSSLSKAKGCKGELLAILGCVTPPPFANPCSKAKSCKGALYM